uniref:Uncharacterized protein n=1 Tax=Timema genevievae TaxID=629358 RepID=A0A7R9JUH1_TIMGE|nr:unnamed protein product [Timema genevievae]
MDREDFRAACLSLSLSLCLVRVYSGLCVFCGGRSRSFEYGFPRFDHTELKSRRFPSLLLWEPCVLVLGLSSRFTWYSASILSLVSVVVEWLVGKGLTLRLNNTGLRRHSSNRPPVTDISGFRYWSDLMKTLTSLTGQQLALTVEFCANPAASHVVWLTPSKAMLPGDFSGLLWAQPLTAGSSPHCQQAALMMRVVTLDDEGEYVFVVRSPRGLAEGTITLNVTHASSFSVPAARAYHICHSEPGKTNIKENGGREKDGSYFSAADFFFICMVQQDEELFFTIPIPRTVKGLCCLELRRYGPRSLSDRVNNGVAIAKGKRWFNIPTRYVFCLMASLGNICLFSLKVSLSVAINAMVKSVSSSYDTSNNQTETDVCPGGETSSTNSSTSEMKDFDWNYFTQNFDWDSVIQSQVLVGMTYGELAACLIGARLAEIFGPRIICGPGIGIAALLNFLCPVAAHWSYVALIALRILQATSIGILLSMALSGKISTALGWEAVFYIYGLITFVWSVCWMFLVYNSPQSHPRISQEEKAYLVANIAEYSKVSFDVPWFEIFTSLSVWAYIMSSVSVLWVVNILMTVLPTYMNKILHFNINQSGYLSALPYLFGIGANLMYGFVSQWFLKRHYKSKLLMYKVLNGIAMVGPALCMITITLVGCDSTTIIVLLILCLMFSGAIFGGGLINNIDLSPNFAGTINAISTMLISIFSILGPSMTGALTNGNQTRSAWSKVFYMTAAISGIPYIIFFLFGSVEEQPWNRPKQAVTLEGAKRKEDD